MSNCDKLKDKVMTSDDWRAKHRPHLVEYEETNGFKSEPFPHPSGEWYWIVCPCGAKHLTTKEAGR
jgi:hypothetical protein